MAPRITKKNKSRHQTLDWSLSVATVITQPIVGLGLGYPTSRQSRVRLPHQSTGSGVARLPLLLLPPQLVGREVVEVGRQLEARGVAACSERLGLALQLGAHRLPALQPLPALLHRFQGLGALLREHQELLVLLWGRADVRQGGGRR